jgi:hypothetical protein
MKRIAGATTLKLKTIKKLRIRCQSTIFLGKGDQIQNIEGL